MTKEELQEIVARLKATNTKDDAYFGIFRYGGGPDESFIKANRQGLELFAAEVLEASMFAEEIVNDHKKNIHSFSYDEEWIDGETLVQYVEPFLEPRQKIKEETVTPSWTDKMFAGGCILFVVICLVLLITGLVTAIKWMF